MIILGIHTGHDASLSLMRDGKLVSAIAVERLSRRKKDDVISKEVFDKFLEKNNISAQDIDVITMGYWYQPSSPFMSVYSLRHTLQDHQNLSKGVLIQHQQGAMSDYG